MDPMLSEAYLAIGLPGAHMIQPPPRDLATILAFAGIVIAAIVIIWSAL
jgi:hypothetical protein